MNKRLFSLFLFSTVATTPTVGFLWLNQSGKDYNTFLNLGHVGSLCHVTSEQRLPVIPWRVGGVKRNLNPVPVQAVTVQLLRSKRLKG